MTNIATEMKKIISLHKKYSLNGHFTTGNQTIQNWPFTTSPNKELVELYDNFNPVDVEIETGLTPLTFYPLEKLNDAQIGYAIKKNKSGNTEAIINWPSNRIVIMDEIGGGKLIIAEISEETTTILAQYEPGSTVKISDSLADFINSLSETIDIVYGKYQIFDVFNDDGTVKDLFLQDFFNTITPIIGHDYCSNLFEYLYG